MNNTEYSRMIMKRTTFSGQTPTINTGDTIDNSWTPTDILTAELYYNIEDKKLYTRSNAEIILLAEGTTNLTGSTTVPPLEDVLIVGNTTGNNHIDVTSGYGIGGSISGGLIESGIEFNGQEFTLKAVEDDFGSPIYGSSEMTFTTTGLTVGRVSSVGTFRGVEYEEDYSTNYTNRSLVDKEYVDNQITGTTASILFEAGGTTDLSIKSKIGVNTLTSDSRYSFVFGDGNTVASDYGIIGGLSNTTPIDANSSNVLGTSCVLGTGIYQNVFGRDITSSGDHSFTIGKDHINSGPYSSVLGRDNDNNGAYNFLSGYQNSATTGTYTSLLGRGNLSTATYGFAAGYLNNISATGGVALGQSNTVAASYGNALGFNNNIGITYGFAVGQSNTVTTSSAGMAMGVTNTVQGITSLAVGTSNTVTGDYSAVIGGTNNTVSGNNSAIIGGSGLTLGKSNTVQVPGLRVDSILNLNTIGNGAPLINLGLDASGNVVTGTTGGGGNATVENFMYSFTAGVDNKPFFDDGNVRFGWDAPGNDLEFYMDTEPAGATDLRALATINYSTQQNTAITTTGVLYDLYSAGVASGNQLNVIITAYQDATYPMYQVDLYNTGTFVTIKITKTTIN